MSFAKIACAPFKTIYSPHLRTARNSRPLEVLGTYDPKPHAPRPGDTHGRPWKDIRLDISRARYWVGVGAQPSDTAWRLLSMVGILEPQYRVGQIQGQVVKADSAAKSLIPELQTTPVVENAKKVEEVLEKEAEA
jgi:small subunit ribosomal protein S16